MWTTLHATGWGEPQDVQDFVHFLYLEIQDTLPFQLWKPYHRGGGEVKQELKSGNKQIDMGQIAPEKDNKADFSNFNPS